MDQQDSYSYVMREWEEAWSQSRHLELMRGQYLGFFFTAIIGVTAIAGPSLVGDSLRSAGSQLVLATLVFGLQTLSAFLYLAVSRINDVLSHYQREIIAIRTAMVPASKDLVDLAAFTWPPRPPRRWASTSGVATRVLQLGIVAFPIALACTAARIMQVDGLSTPAIFCLALFLASVVIALVARLGRSEPGLGVPSRPSEAPRP